MKILGIHDGLTASACLLEDSHILSMASEERFTNIKNQGGFPANAIRWVMAATNTAPEELDLIAAAGLIPPIKDTSVYTIGRHKWFSYASQIVPAAILGSKTLVQAYISQNRAKREQGLLQQLQPLGLGHGASKLRFVEHHECHAATTYYLDWNFAPDRKVLILTLDGSGDGICATVSVGEHYKITRIASTPSFHSLGMLYARMTQFLGMKPHEHEYKLMGMAPYAPDFLAEKSYNVLKRYLRLDPSGLSFENTSRAWGNQIISRFQRDLVTHRFDGICAGLQKLTEELVVQWILNCIQATGIADIVVAGGVFMNVKLNMLINEHPAIRSVFFMPTCGDESTALGAAIHSYVARQLEQQLTPALTPIKTLYVGPEYGNAEIEAVLQQTPGIAYKYYDDINTQLVDLLLHDKNLGRLAGRMEFGARALGNRSIIANPGNWESVRKINHAIKMRDFWMPFAPSILDTAKERYLVSTKPKKAPYMILGFETTPAARAEIIAGLHQFDFSCRPQIVEQDWNPEYYDLLSKYEQASGIPGVLNTSFNIHGYPMINSPADALWTLQNSALDAIQLGNFLVTRT